MKRLKNLLFVMLLGFLAWNCQKEEAHYLEPIQETADKNVQLKALTIDELPGLSGSIEQQASKVGWASKNNGDDVVLDGSRVLAVTDSVGNTTYSLRMYVPGTPHNVFYNVVSKRTHDGVQREPFVLRYEVKEDYWPEYVMGPRQEKPFKGTIGVYKLEDFDLQLDQNGKMGSEPEPCLQLDTNGDEDEGGGGNNSNNEEGNGTDHDPGSYYDYWNTYAPENGGGNGDDTEPFVEIGEGKFGNYGEDGILKASLTGKSADCPEEETLLPINEEDEKIIYLLEDYPCQSEIIKDALEANSPLTDLVMDIFNSDVKPSITIQADDLDDIFWGGYTTVQNGNPFHYLITINTERLDVSTDIDIASTAIHESVHALLFYFYQAGSFQSNNESYAQLVEDFTIHQASFGGDHHQYMQNFVGDIADSLYSWSINNDYLPNNFTEYDTNDSKNYDGLREYLGKLAWNGLTDTGTFELLYPEGTLERQNMIQLINSESLPYENSANPKGTICD